VTFYRAAMKTLRAAGVPFLVGGAYALRVYTGIERHTKDFDIFVHPADLQRAFAAFAAAGYETEMLADYWLAKAFAGPIFVDLIFGSGNGAARVDRAWFEHAVEAEVFGLPVRLVPPEEMIWSKAYIMERERYDGADIAHVLLNWGERLDWLRLLDRFGPNWRVLLNYLVLFGFIYPGQRDRVPRGVMERLLARLHEELVTPPPDERRCNGTLLSRQQYLSDIVDADFTDGRLAQDYLTPEQIEQYTAGISKDGKPSDEQALERLERRLHIVLREQAAHFRELDERAEQ
jgi:hypothetical protein